MLHRSVSVGHPNHKLVPPPYASDLNNIRIRNGRHKTKQKKNKNKIILYWTASNDDDDDDLLLLKINSVWLEKSVRVGERGECWQMDNMKWIDWMKQPNEHEPLIRLRIWTSNDINRITITTIIKMINNKGVIEVISFASKSAKVVFFPVSFHRAEEIKFSYNVKKKEREK